MFDEPIVAGKALFELLHDGGNSGAWLASLIPFVHQVFATASYQSVFIGTCFVTTPEGHFVSARHVVEEAWKLWTGTNHDSAVGNWAAPGALWMPGPYLVPVAALTMLGDEDVGPDLAWGNCTVFNVTVANPNLSCRYYQVPMDYFDCTAGKARLAVVKYQAAVPKKKTIHASQKHSR